MKLSISFFSNRYHDILRRVTDQIYQPSSIQMSFFNNYYPVSKFVIDSSHSGLLPKRIFNPVGEGLFAFTITSFDKTIDYASSLLCDMFNFSTRLTYCVWPLVLHFTFTWYFSERYLMIIASEFLFLFYYHSLLRLLLPNRFYRFILLHRPISKGTL